MKNPTGYTYSKPTPKVTDRHGKDVPFANPEDVAYWDRLFVVSLTQTDVGVAVFADSAGDAFEYAVEYAAENGYRGLYLDMGDPADKDAIAELEGFEQILWADKGLCCDSGEVTIFEIER